MFRWRKLGLTFAPRQYQGREWMQTHAQAPASLDLGALIRMYFASRPVPDAEGQFVSRIGYVDLSAEDPTRVLSVCEEPVIPLGRLGTFDEFGTYPMSVTRSREGGDEILGYYAGWTRCESVPFNTAIGLAVSTDEGQTFNRVGDGPILGYCPDEPFVISGPKIRVFNGTYYLFYIAGKKWKIVSGKPEPVYRIRLATSTDGLSWQRLGKDLISPRIEGDEAQASPDVWLRDGKYHMLFSYRRSQDFRGRKGGYRLGYACSDDLIAWHRDDSLAGLDVSDFGWDSEMIAYPHVFEAAGSLYLAYLGNAVGRDGFGLAILED